MIKYIVRGTWLFIVMGLLLFQIALMAAESPNDQIKNSLITQYKKAEELFKQEKVVTEIGRAVHAVSWRPRAAL